MNTDSAAPSKGKDESAWRLPRKVKPIRYEVLLAPDLVGFTFSGEVTIECTVLEPTDEIVVNAADLEITDTGVVAGGKLVRVSSTGVDKEFERVHIALDEELEAGENASVSLKFEGALTDQLRGFYLSKISDDAGFIATTHFEPTDARRAFPCFDEPDLKAVFSITVDVPEGMGVWSNWSVESEDALESGGRRVRFGDSMKMSTYLVAAVVGPLQQTEPVDVGGIPVSVVHVAGKGHMTSFALEAAEHSIKFFQDWFGIPYPASKLDLIALPDFAMGAMENLGCVTFRETALLVDTDNASLSDLQRVAQVVEHEIAHMWFGDLVTMRWWDGIWLNEAFATFMEVTCGNDFRPDWDLWTSFGTMRERAMSIDGLHSTRPIEYPVGAPQEAEGMFDPLTYEKGAGVLRMLEKYIGPDKFREGIRIYLNKHSYGNTDTPDLWSAIEEASGAPVSSIMGTWIHQGGFPLVGVASTGHGVSLTQEPFMYLPAPEDRPSAIGKRWQIPVLFRGVDSDPVDRGLIGSELDSELRIHSETDGEPIVVNAEGSGVFRVHYAPELLAQLSDHLSDLDRLERFYLLSDSWAGVLAGTGDLADFLAIAGRLENENDPDVWGQVTGALSLLDKVLPDASREGLATYVRALVGPVFGELGWDKRSGDTERLRALRGQLLASLGTIGADPDIRSECLRREKAYIDSGSPLDPDLGSAIVATVADAGGPDEYEGCLDKMRNPSTPQEEMRYLQALANFRDPSLAERSFDLAMSGMRVQNAPSLILLLLANRSNGEATWKRVVDRWDELNQKFPEMLVTRMLDGVRFICREPALSNEIIAFLKAHPVPSGELTVMQACERLQINTSLATRLGSVAGPVLAAATERLG